MALKRILLAALIFLNLFLAYRLFLGDNGIQAYLELKDTHAEMQELRDLTSHKSMELSREIRMLKSNDAHVADTIRKRMNYLKDKELLYLSSEKTLNEKAAGAEVYENQD